MTFCTLKGCSVNTQAACLGCPEYISYYAEKKKFGGSDDEKKYYRVSLRAEGCAHGYVRLTDSEAALIRKVTNPDNWLYIHDDDYHGSFAISEKPVSKEDIIKNIKAQSEED